MSISGRLKKHDPKAREIASAVRNSDVVALQQYISEGLVNLTDGQDRTALIHASIENNLEILQFLIKNGVMLDAQERNGFTALHYAVESQNQEAFKLLISAGANANTIDYYGNTPLWTAVFKRSKNQYFIEQLMKLGLDPKHTNEADRSPLDMAETFGKEEVISILKYG